jgi:DNA-binding response OmpR family regulator
MPYGRPFGKIALAGNQRKEGVSDMQGKRILVIDDNPDVLRLLEYVFSKAGAQVYTATTGRDGLHLFHLRAHQPHLVILDVMMPEMDGWEVCARIRQLSDVPIIFLTALSGEDDVVRGLDDGAVDYVPKPCSSKVLLARARAALRQAELTSESEKLVSFRDDYLMIDLDQRRVLVCGQPVNLSAIEYRLLAYLLQNAGRVLTFRQILDNGWGGRFLDSVNYVHAYVWQLREKLEEDPKHPRYLLTEQGVGYQFQKPSPVETA